MNVKAESEGVLGGLNNAKKTGGQGRLGTGGKKEWKNKVKRTRVLGARLTERKGWKG